MLTEAELLAMPADAYMSEPQQAYFRELLLHQRSELQERIAGEFEHLREQEPASDPADLGSAEEQRRWQLRLLEREKKLLDKIDEALDRLARGEYGWCTGSACVSLRTALPRKMAPSQAREAANGHPLASPATQIGAIFRATRRAGPLFVRDRVIRRSFGATKFLSSCLAPHKKWLRRGRNETQADPATGEPIGLKRLLLRPTASLCIEAKERQEQKEKHQREA